MPANYLHGVETIELDKGARPIRGVKTAVIGLVGTAPIYRVDEADRSVNEPVLVLNDRDAVKYFGAAREVYTIPQALKAIFDQGKGTVIVVNVLDPSVHKSAVADEEKTFGDDDTLTLDHEGVADAVVKNTAGSVTYTKGTDYIINEADGVITRIEGGLIQAGQTVKVSYNHVDPEEVEPFSSRVAGAIAAKDIEKGYWWSPSNTDIKGIVGVERKLSAMINDPNSEVNILNENGIITIFSSFGSGFRIWGNRSAAWPSVTHPKNFINVRRVADILHESVEYSMLQFIDHPIDNALIDAITESVNSFIRTLMARGAIISGRCWYDKAKNPTTEIALGHLTFDIEFMPPVPAERISFESFINIELLKALGGK